MIINVKKPNSDGTYLVDCERYWVNFINSFPDDDINDPFGSVRAATIQRHLKEDYNARSYHDVYLKQYLLDIPEENFELFLLKWA